MIIMIMCFSAVKNLRMELKAQEKDWYSHIVSLAHVSKFYFNVKKCEKEFMALKNLKHLLANATFVWANFQA